MIVEPINYIHRDERGIAWIAGSRTKVIEVAIDQAAYGWDAEEIHAAHPHLPLAQIHAALSYYYDHKAELDTEIRRQMDEYEARRGQPGAQLSRAELQKRLAAR
jgi:uncharacterized protein (DUF433 family)